MLAARHGGVLMAIADLCARLQILLPGMRAGRPLIQRWSRETGCCGFLGYSRPIVCMTFG
ncbi:MAG: hypothetical protein CGU29_01610 [Candidatus Dactylopiibacterium carminicum]|uniref:Uncharacterized protein n=1 Tax=Candidatus Dactylopiibacterium carminicum TaxID=857335 RepID=A0A272EYQ5_9RHOO|nr:MAG: hypothetical protein CGU29_01610 [Candidatus Dactylopiibacterium carminicum]